MTVKTGLHTVPYTKASDADYRGNFNQPVLNIERKNWEQGTSIYNICIKELGTKVHLIIIYVYKNREQGTSIYNIYVHCTRTGNKVRLIIIYVQEQGTRFV